MKIWNRRKWMKVACGLSIFGICSFAAPVFAADASGERPEESVTSMDEEGNMQKVDSGPKLIENPAGPNKSRTGEPQVVNFRTKNNAVTEFIEQETAKPGYTNGAYGADAVYLGYANGKYKFMLSGVVGWVKESEVQVVNLSQAKVVSCYEVKEGKLLHHIVQDMTTPGYATSLNNGPAPSYLEPGVTYYSYDGHYFYRDYGVMVSDYRKDERSQSVNPEEPYYNYFQYLPMRSQSSYTGAEINTILDEMIKKDSKMKDTGEIFVNNQDTYGVNALLMAGIAANESNWGKSSISQKKNNLFGLNATDATPGINANRYSSVTACIEDFANGWMSRGYLYPKDYRYNGGFLGNKASGLNVKYASDPYWGEKAANIVWRLDHSMGEKDARKYTLAVKEIVPKDHISVNVRKEPSASSTLLYKTGKAANYVVLTRKSEPVDGFYEVQSDGVLDKERSKVVKENGTYNFQQMYGYISSDYLTVISKAENEGTQEQEPAVPEEKQLDSIQITVPPAKTAYEEGETFDKTGMQVLALWSDGNKTDVTAEIQYTKEPFKQIDTEIKIQYTYEDVVKEAVQAITVAAKEPEQEAKPEQNQESEEITLFVTPEAIEVSKGGTQQFGVTVKSETGVVPQLVWAVVGNQSEKTIIDDHGMLTVGEDETADKIIVRAALAADNTRGADAVAVIAKEQEDSQEEPEIQEGETVTPEEPEKQENEAVVPTPEQPEEQEKQPVEDNKTQETEQNLSGQEVNQEVPKTEEKQPQEKQQKKKESAKTGDETQISLFALAGSLAALMLLYMVVKERKKIFD